MSQDKYIAAIEVSSSKIIGAVGRYTSPTARLDVIAVEQELAIECVRNGIIHNVEETATRIARIIDKLEHRTGVAPRHIKRILVGLAGRSLRNIPREIHRNLPDDTEITDDILRNMADEARRSQIDASLDVIDAIPATYMVNKSETKSPVGTFGNTLDVKFQLIAARPILARHLNRVIHDKVGLDIAGIVVTPVAVANLILSDDEKRLGCMLVDMGAETTTVSIYQKGDLHYLAVLPMGSRNITRDITSLSVLEKDAENVKTNSGKAIASDDVSNLNINGMRLSDVSNLVVARSQELIANIIEQITYAGITSQQLPGGIITVGGGFNLNQMGELLRRQSDLKVRRGSLPDFVTLEDTKAPSYETIEVISILSAGTHPAAPECLELNSHPHTLTESQDFDTPPEDTDTPRQPVQPRRLKKRPRRNNDPGSLLNKIKIGLAGIFNSATEDDDEPELD